MVESEGDQAASGRGLDGACGASVVTMGLAVPEPDALGQPLSEGFYP